MCRHRSIFLAKLLLIRVPLLVQLVLKNDHLNFEKVCSKDQVQSSALTFDGFALHHRRLQVSAYYTDLTELAYLMYLWPMRFHPIHHFPGTILEMMHFKAVIFRMEEPGTFSNEVDKYNTINCTKKIMYLIISSNVSLSECVCP